MATSRQDGKVPGLKVSTARPKVLTTVGPLWGKTGENNRALGGRLGRASSISLADVCPETGGSQGSERPGGRSAAPSNAAQARANAAAAPFGQNPSMPRWPEAGWSTNRRVQSKRSPSKASHRSPAAPWSEAGTEQVNSRQIASSSINVSAKFLCWPATRSSALHNAPASAAVSSVAHPSPPIRKGKGSRWESQTSRQPWPSRSSTRMGQPGSRSG